MKNKVTPDPGRPPIEILDNIPDVDIKYLTTIFNLCLQNQEVQSEWKLSFISSRKEKERSVVTTGKAECYT